MKMIPENHTVADEAALMAGTTSSTVADLQVLNDGNVYNIIEGGGTPGFDLHLIFNHVLRFTGLAFKAQYDPGTHYIEVRLMNYVTGIRDTYTTVVQTSGMNYRFIDILDFTPYIKNSIVEIDFDHIPGGVASHRMNIDYVALVR